MKKLVIILFSLMPFVASNAQELIEVMRIEMQDTVLVLKVSEIKFFTFDTIEWIDAPTDTIPELEEPEDPQEPEEPELDYTLRILTFEDEDAKFTPYTLDYAGVDITTWSDLIDNPEYGGPLCYGDYMSCEYTWWDENNTELTHTFPYNYYAYCFWGGGHAISNYASTDYVNYGTYENQLRVYGEEDAGGHNGSKNFCMHFGYKDNSPWNDTEYLPALSFADGEARVIDHMYVNNSAYAINCYMNGNGLTANIGEEDWVKLLATGYDADGNETGTVEFYMVNGPDYIITEWAKWDLSGLGAVVSIEFNVTGSSDNGYGYSQPAYFAYDDVAVRFEKK